MRQTQQWLAATFFAGAMILGQAGTVPTMTVKESSVEGVSESLRREGLAAVEKGMRWLLAQQQPTGAWSNPDMPALTGLPLWALARGQCADTNAERRAVAHILSCVHENGAIYREPKVKAKGGGLPNYNTAICMVALHALGDAALTPVVLRARTYVAASQHLGGDVYRGGMGYDRETGRAYADLSNSYLAYEAMRLTQGAEEYRKEGKPADLDWKAAQEFLQRVQNDPTVNTQAWASADPSETGGFAYHPEQTRDGTFTNAAGEVKFRSMPGMTYAGLISYIYADVKRDDPRVQATLNWVRNNWSLEKSNRDPALAGKPEEREGLFYLYNVMSKGLAAYGQDVLSPDHGAPFNWRAQLITKLLATQKTDPKTGTGYWLNDNGRYMESDPVLVTSYALIALEIALGR